MDIESIIAKVDGILIEEFELSPEDVVPEARLREDLELDSLDGMDLMVALEKEFGVRVDEKRLMTLTTVGELHAFLRTTAEAVDVSG